MGMERVVAGALLANINGPADLQKLDIQELPQLCQELRQFIIDTVSLYGGHFAAGLGVVELTVALHYVLNTPQDKLVWDVGHQAYGHKILTGRREQFATNRKWNGISGFPKRAESEYDAFGTGHSSTSISAALGMAIADKLQGNLNRQHVAVIGDGGLTAGIAFEALNHVAVSGTNMLIVLNDNNMSIDPAVGALKESMFASSANQSSSTAAHFFEAFGIPYFGTVDGHDSLKLVPELKKILALPGPKLLHVKTTKGKGYQPAEEDQTLWHATGSFDKISGTLNKTNSSDRPQPPKYQDVFGKTILELARLNPKIMGITPAMPSGSSLKYMMAEMPERALDVGIAEQHAVTLSAGLATQGMKVFCTIYSTFLQRAYDMVIHDVAIQDLPVIFCIDRAGLVGEDGATHQGAYDIAYLRCIPNMIVSAPMNEQELRNLMFTAQLEETKHPFAIRYPRGQGVMVDWQKPFERIGIGKGRIISEGEKVAVLSIGHVGNLVQEAIGFLNREDIRPAHFDMRFVKPLDSSLLLEIAGSFDKIITLEDGCVRGGFGSAILEFFNENGCRPKLKMLGIPDKIIEQGTQQQQREASGFDVFDIVEAIREMWG